MSNDKIMWLHISDLHFRVSDLHRWNESVVLNSLLEDLREQQKSGLKLDFILVSGDIAYAGQPTEYSIARDFFDNLLAIVGLSTDRLFMVPGNHDVSRSILTRGAKAIADDLVASSSKENLRRSVTEVIGNAEDRALVYKGMQHYKEFIQTYFSQNQLEYSDTKPFYIKHLALSGIKVAILGLDSAWLCYGTNDDRNRALVGERRVRTSIDEIRDADLRIGLLHHPFEWLQDYDRQDVESLLRKHCDFILHGHLHRASMMQLTTPDSGAIVIAAGASYQDREKTNAYNLVELNLHQGGGRVILRRYSDEGTGFWTKDVMTYQNVKDGEYLFPLKIKSNDHHSKIAKQDSELEEDLSHWPDFGSYADSKYLVLVRAEKIKTHLVSMLEALRLSDYSHHSTTGKFRVAANQLIEHDIKSLTMLLQSDVGTLKTAWTLLFAIERDVDNLSEEYLDFQAGSLLGKGNEICGWVDALLHEIGGYTGDGWQGTCVLGNRPIAGFNSHLVRLCYPQEDIWSIPLAIHQYASLLQITMLPAILINFAEPRVNPQDGKVLPILVADMLASYFSGPAYAFAAATIWFNPARSDMLEDSNLLFDLRFNYLVNTLERVENVFVSEIELLKRIWREKQVGDKPKDPDYGLRFNRYMSYFDELYKQLVQFKYGAAFIPKQHKAVAKKIVESYQSQWTQEPSKVDLIDILNAAWYSRMLSDKSTDLNSMAEYYRDLYRRKVAVIKQ